MRTGVMTSILNQLDPDPIAFGSHWVCATLLRILVKIEHMGTEWAITTRVLKMA